MVLKTILHGQMTEKIAFEVKPKNGKKMQEVPLLKSVFLTTWPFGGSKKIVTHQIKIVTHQI